MNDINKVLRLPVKHAQANDPMTKVGSYFSIPGATSNPVGLSWVCQLCGCEVLPMQLRNGLYVERRSCPCVTKKRQEAEEEQIRIAWEAAQAHRTFGGWLGVSWSDSHLTQKTFATFMRERDPNAFTEATRFANSMSGNLVFYSAEYGTGKSHLAAAICNAIRQRRVTSLFAPVAKFFAAYNERMKHEGDYHGLVKQVTHTPLLVLDDVDAAHATDFRYEMYFLVLDERYKAGLPTIITTNSIEQLHKYIGEKARSRFMRGLVAVEMQGSDFRTEER